MVPYGPYGGFNGAPFMPQYYMDGQMGMMGHQTQQPGQPPQPGPPHMMQQPPPQEFDLQQQQQQHAQHPQSQQQARKPKTFSFNVGAAAFTPGGAGGGSGVPQAFVPGAAAPFTPGAFTPGASFTPGAQPFTPNGSAQGMPAGAPTYAVHSSGAPSYYSAQDTPIESIFQLIKDNRLPQLPVLVGGRFEARVCGASKLRLSQPVAFATARLVDVRGQDFSVQIGDTICDAADLVVEKYVPVEAVGVKRGEGKSEEAHKGLESPQTPVAKPAKSSWAAAASKAVPKVEKKAAAEGAKEDAKAGELGGAADEASETDSPAALLAARPRGIVNNGNVCFINSILQILVHCLPFSRLIDLIREKVPRSLDGDSPLTEAVVDFLDDYKRGAVNGVNGGSTPATSKLPDITIDSFYKSIVSVPRFAHFQRGKQEDAEEFLGYLLDGLHEEFVAVIGAKEEAVEEGSSGSAEWTQVGAKKNSTTRSPQFPWSPVSDIFGGKFESNLDVPRQSVSKVLEPFHVIHLDVENPNISTVEAGFKALSAKEQVETFREAGGPPVTASKQTLLDELPRILVVQLKRFTYSGTDLMDLQVRKINKKISYGASLSVPMESLSLKGKQQFRASGGKSNQYNLVGVVFHHGTSTTTGHYTVNVLVGGSKWYRIDDVKIEAIRNENWYAMEEDGKDDKTAYLLIYQRV
ncbi:Ubiquitin carboxyl-terminal hydrolase 10 [Yarrowia sp. B02]|nr:Ubiquitin carboxyl-terminal hydrolase 10 [Yarrowia sp. B02]